MREGAPNKRLYIVPATINYRLVLEAETLIDDFLAETGKSRYIIADDEFSRVGRIVAFFRKILVHEGSVSCGSAARSIRSATTSPTTASRSIAPGRIVDPASYVRGADGEVTDDDQRDAEYTRALGRRLAAGRTRGSPCSTRRTWSRARSTTRSRARAGTRDIYRLLRAAAAQLAVPVDRRGRRRSCGCARGSRRHPAWGAEHPLLRAAGRAPTSVDDAVRGLSSYHTRPVVERSGDALHVDDVKLLYYYQNRTAHVPAEASS